MLVPTYPGAGITWHTTLGRFGLSQPGEKLCISWVVTWVSTPCKGTATSPCHVLVFPLSSDHAVCLLQKFGSAMGSVQSMCKCTGGFLVWIIAAVMPVVPALLVICNALGHFLTPNHHLQLHPLVAVRCILIHGCMSSWVLAFRLEHQPVLSIMKKYYISISLCLEQPHLLRNRALKAENKIGWKLLGGSILLELCVPLFEKRVAFSVWRTVWLAGLWGVFFCKACVFETISSSPTWKKMWLPTKLLKLLDYDISKWEKLWL